MSGRSRREWMLGAGALGTAALARIADPSRAVGDPRAADLADKIPRVIGSRVGEDDPDVVPDTVDGGARAGQALARRYIEIAASPIMLLIDHHGSDSPELKVHRPETCYAVAGFRTEPSSRLHLDLDGASVPAAWFSARRGLRFETVLYWTRVGRSFPQTLTAQRLAFIQQAVNGVRADGLLARMSMIGEDRAAHLHQLNRFAADLVRNSPRARDLLLGPS